MRAPIDERALSLADLRKRLGRSQASVAQAIGTTQSGVSRIEHQDDMHVSTVDEYVAALGGRLHLHVEHPSGNAEIRVPSLREERPSKARREFRVIWQDQQTRALVQVGWLEFTGQEFLFSYTEAASTHPRFEPFPPFPVYEKTYRSEELFTFFSVRLTSTADPQYGAVLDALGLTREDATPAELLARLPSDSPHDTIQVVPEPVEQPDGTLVRTFLVSGIRHANEEDPESVSRLVQKLHTGDTLTLVAEPENPSNPDAMQLATGGKPVGWIPDYLVDEIHDYLRADKELTVRVASANGPDAPWHLRLLCEMTVGPGA